MASRSNFEERINRIAKHHGSLGKGAVYRLEDDGLIVAAPVPERYRPKFPLKGVVGLIMLGFIFKGIMLSEIGLESYQARIDRLSQGTVMEQAGAWLMAADPATKVFALGFDNIIP